MDQPEPKDVTRRRAFTAFTRAFTSWYPGEHTWSGNSLTLIGVEPWKGGRCFDGGPRNANDTLGRY